MKAMKLNAQLFASNGCSVTVKSISQNIVGNYSIITIKGVLTTGSQSYNHGGAYMQPVISNQPVVGNQGSSQTLSKKKYSIGTNGTKEDEWTFTVYHNSDGSCNNLNISIEWYITDRSNGTVSLSGGCKPTTIPRASDVSANDGVLNRPLSINIDRKSESFMHTLRYVCGNSSGWINDADNKVATSATWTPPLSLANEAQSADSVECGIFCQTYSSNGDLISVEDVVTINLTIPSMPPINVNIDSINDYNSYKNTYGVFIQNKSRIRATLVGTPQYTTIKNYSWQIRQTDSSGVILASGTSATIDYIPTTSGTLYISGTITDYRDKSTSTSTTVSVTAYSIPKCQLVVSRTDATSANYTATGSGTELSVTGYTENIVTYILKRDSTTIATWTGASLNQSGIDTILDQSYTYTLTAQDTISGIQDTKTIPISTTFTLMNFSASGNSMAIGKASEASPTEKLLEVAINSTFEKNVNLDGLFTLKGYEALFHASDENFTILSANNQNIYLRPSGIWNGTGQIYITPNGNVYASGDINTSGDIYASGDINTSGDIYASNYVGDWNGHSNSEYMLTYDSSNEQVVGSFDNKPIYRKILHSTRTISSSSSGTVGYLDNPTGIISLTGAVKITGDNWLSLPAAHNGAFKWQVGMYYNNSDKSITVETGSGRTVTETYVVCLYLKK